MLARAAWFSGLFGIMVVNCKSAAVICSSFVLRSKEMPSDKLDIASV
jgi:hypothetical protein